MNHLLDSLNTCIEKQNWSAALALALMVPDVFAKIAYPEVKQVGTRYAKWFDEFVNINSKSNSLPPPSEWQPLIDGWVCYALRCAYLHTATTELEGKSIRERLSKVRFIYSPEFHRNQINGILFLDAGTFCTDMLNAGQNYTLGQPLPFGDLELVLKPNANGTIETAIPGLGSVAFRVKTKRE